MLVDARPLCLSKFLIRICNTLKIEINAISTLNRAWQHVHNGRLTLLTCWTQPSNGWIEHAKSLFLPILRCRHFSGSILYCTYSEQRVFRMTNISNTKFYPTGTSTVDVNGQIFFNMNTMIYKIFNQDTSTPPPTITQQPLLNLRPEVGR